MITGTIASTVLNFLHGSEEPPKQKDDGEVPEWAKEQETAVSAETAEASPAGEEGDAHYVKASSTKVATNPQRRKSKK